MTPPATAAAKRAPARRAAGRTRVNRRVSGPAPARAPGRTTTRRAPAAAPQLRPLPAIGAIALRAGRSLQDSSMLDRLLRGRTWIGFLGVLLIGLVALNVSLLKLNAQAGRNAEVAKKLRVQNADLRGRVSRLGSGDRLQEAAARLGFVMPAAGNVHYLKANTPLDARRALKRDEMSPLPFTSDIVSGVPDQPLTAPLTVQGPTATPAPADATGTSGAAGPTGAATPETTVETMPQPEPAATAPAPDPTTQPPAGTPPSGGAAQP